MRIILKTKPPAKRPRNSEAEDGTLTDRAYRELEEMIVTLRLSPGTILSEQALAQRLLLDGPSNRLSSRGKNPSGFLAKGRRSL
jgi:hypothetical protein